MIDCNTILNAIKKCPDMQIAIQDLINQLDQFDQIKTNSADHEPTQEELSALWNDCPAPEASMVFWYNTTTMYIGIWLNPTGDYYELV